MFWVSLFVALLCNNGIIMQGFGNGEGKNSEDVDWARAVHTAKLILHLVERIVHLLFVSTEVKLEMLLV